MMESSNSPLSLRNFLPSRRVIKLTSFGIISTDITEGHARAIAGLVDVKLMIEAYKKILAEGSSVRRTEDLVRRIKEEKSIPVRKSADRIQSVELENIAKEISNKLGTIVKVNQSTIAAKIQIIFKGAPEETTAAIKQMQELLLRNPSGS